MEFDTSTPYVLRQFSETLRQLLQNGMSKAESIFPINNRLKEPLRQSFNDSIFHNGKVVLDERTGQKIKNGGPRNECSFHDLECWTKRIYAFVNGFYWLCPPSKVSKKMIINMSL